MMKISQFVLGLAITLSVNIAIAGGNTWQNADSEYTKCNNFKREERASCLGKDDYSIQAWQDDDFTYLAVSYKNMSMHDTMWGGLKFPPAFEWRFHYENGKKVYHALIYRSNSTKFLGVKKGSYLNVVRLGKEQSCSLGEIRNSKNMNAKARRLADKKNARCVDEPLKLDLSILLSAPPEPGVPYEPTKTTKSPQPTQQKKQATAKKITDKPKVVYTTTSWGKTGNEYQKPNHKGCVESESDDFVLIVKCNGKGRYKYVISTSAEHGNDGLELFYKGKNVTFGGGGNEQTSIDGLEWRFHFENGKKVYHALILSVSKREDIYFKPTKYDNRVEVIRLDKEKSCQLDSGKNTVIKTKAKARQLADDKNAKCQDDGTEDDTEVTTDDSVENNTDSTDSNTDTDASRTDNNTDGDTDKSDASSTDSTPNNANTKDDENIPEVRKQAAKMIAKEATCGGDILEIFPIQKGKYYAVHWRTDLGCDGGNTEYTVLSSFKYSKTAKTFILDKYSLLRKFNIAVLGSVEQINPTTFEIRSWDYQSSDPRCCPSISYTHIITYKNGRWTVVKTEKKIERQ